MVVCTFIRDSLAKINNGDEDWDTHSCCTLPGSEFYMVPLADSLAKTDSGDGDEDTQTDAMVDNILPSSK